MPLGLLFEDDLVFCSQIAEELRGSADVLRGDSASFPEPSKGVRLKDDAASTITQLGGRPFEDRDIKPLFLE